MKIPHDQRWLSLSELAGIVLVTLLPLGALAVVGSGELEAAQGVLASLSPLPARGPSRTSPDHRLHAFPGVATASPAARVKAHIAERTHKGRTGTKLRLGLGAGPKHDRFGPATRNGADVRDQGATTESQPMDETPPPSRPSARESSPSAADGRKAPAFSVRVKGVGQLVQVAVGDDGVTAEGSGGERAASPTVTVDVASAHAPVDVDRGGSTPGPSLEATLTP